MTERKWTPGPWVYVDDDYNGEFFGCGVAQHNGAPEFIWFDDCIDVDTDIATAHLISAAPDLYDALDRMSKMCPDIITQDALDALAKARGEQ